MAKENQYTTCPFEVKGSPLKCKMTGKTCPKQRKKYPWLKKAEDTENMLGCEKFTEEIEKKVIPKIKNDFLGILPEEFRNTIESANKVEILQSNQKHQEALKQIIETNKKNYQVYPDAVHRFGLAEKTIAANIEMLQEEIKKLSPEATAKNTGSRPARVETGPPGV